MLLKQKNDQRQQELTDFQDKTQNNKANLYEELKSIDTKVKAKDQISKLEETFEQENIESTDFDKRLALYRKLRE